MGRKFKSTERFLKPDHKYNNIIVSKFINCLMWQGKKSIAEEIMYKAMDFMKEKTGEDELKVFLKALENAKPVIEVRSKRVGGQNLQVPMQVSPKRRQSLGMRWLISSARASSGKPMHQRLAAELLSAYKGEGAAVTKKDNVHKMAEANKAFAHFAR